MPLLMIPGPIEVSPAVVEAASGAPPGHLAPALIESFGAALEAMRRVWLAPPDSQPFVVAGSGTLAMEMAATNLLDPGDGALVVSSGYFSERMAEMLRRRGASVTVVSAEPGDAPSLDAVEEALSSGRHRALFATHVDTSTGVRVDARALAQIARAHDVLSVFDGVCATAAERFEMEAWGADVYLTASQKAIGLPPGLALLVASRRALEARARLASPPPMSIDFEEWRPIMRAYEERRPGYFSTPATTLVRALDVSLREILADGMDARFALHARGAAAMRAAWSALGLREVPARPELAASTLSALWLPEGVGPELVASVGERGVVVAGGLHPAIRARYFRVGHMGHVLTRPEALRATVRAIAEALCQHGHACDAAAAVAALDASL
ncbi:MAG: alanine--glyoxylate aminotransferase family protein [Sandaracinaceae bacterium]|nr:alanine--glyoxylate aminotransferase family protein [Sandaracinaceae bacterium]